VNDAATSPAARSQPANEAAAVADPHSIGLQHALERATFMPLFSVPLMCHLWGDLGALNEQLRTRILAQAQREASDKRSNVGGWHSPSGQLEFLGELRKPLIERMYLMANEATRRLALERGMTPFSVQWSFYAWANVSGTGDFNTTHTHPGATWSGVYYVDAGDSPGEHDAAALRFLDPMPGSAHAFFPYQLRPCPELQPAAGLMVLFPSYVPHMVHPHRGSGQRISIAFNFRKEPYP
jgi:uncharacterized protein (TIGR02466 family)